MTGIDASVAVGWVGVIIFGACSVWLILDGAFDEVLVEPTTVRLQIEVAAERPVKATDLGGACPGNARFVNDVDRD
jgi:hypothetical protein